jgi:hypothetical protein
MKYSAEELKKVCGNHIKWLRGEAGGKRAYLSGADLSWADLSGADLYGADLSGADLSRANLPGANLSRADLSGADLSGADLSGADLPGANLSRADLSRADLSWADLSGADLSGADLPGANLSRADLSGAKNAELAWAITIVSAEGDIVGWKKARRENGGGECIVKLLIPAAAKRSNATGRKCRAEYAIVTEVIGAEYAISARYGTKYMPGARVDADSWDDNRWEECSHGIHFFITREEAEAWQL